MKYFNEPVNLIQPWVIPPHNTKEYKGWVAIDGNGTLFWEGKLGLFSGKQKRVIEHIVGTKRYVLTIGLAQYSHWFQDPNPKYITEFINPLNGNKFLSGLIMGQETTMLFQIWLKENGFIEE